VAATVYEYYGNFDSRSIVAPSGKASEPADSQEESAKGRSMMGLELSEGNGEFFALDCQ
jgi:hypothetical protein